MRLSAMTAEIVVLRKEVSRSDRVHVDSLGLLVTDIDKVLTGTLKGEDAKPKRSLNCSEAQSPADASCVRRAAMVVSMHHTIIEEGGDCHRHLRVTCRTSAKPCEKCTAPMTPRVTCHGTPRARSWTTPTPRMKYKCPQPPLRPPFRGLHEVLWV